MAKPKKDRLDNDIFKDPRVVRIFADAHRRPEFWEGTPDKENSLLSDPAATLDEID